MSDSQTTSAATERGYGALIMPAIMLAFAGYLIYGLLTMNVVESEELLGPTAMPWITAIALIVLAIIYVVDVVRHPGAQHGADSSTPTAVNWRAVGIALVTMIIFVSTLEIIGWLLGGALLFFGMVTALGLSDGSARHPVRNLLLALSVSAIIQLIFGGVLGLPLPGGMIIGAR